MAVKPTGWGGGYDFADKLKILGLGYNLDDEREYDIYVGDGGPESAFFHHYIVIDSPDLPDNNRYIVFELAKGSEANSSSGALVPGVRVYSGGGLKYHITIRATLRSISKPPHPNYSIYMHCIGIDNIYRTGIKYL